MRCLPLALVAALAPPALVACGGDDGAGSIDADLGPDAEPTPYGCIGRAFPTGAPDPLAVSGHTNEISTTGQTPISGVALLVASAADATLASGTSDTTDVGAYAMTIATGGAPVAGYLKGTKANYKDTYVYPPAPLATDLANVPVLLVSTTVYPFVPIIANASQDASHGFLGVLVSDCLGNAVAGATVTSASAEAVRYVMGTSIGDETVTETDASGIAILFNVTPGDAISVDASTADQEFAEHTVKVRADVVTTTIVAPGPIPGLAP